MNLKEAQEEAIHYRYSRLYELRIPEQAALILDDHIVELEKQLAEHVVYANAMKLDREAVLQRADETDMEVGRLRAQRDKLLDTLITGTIALRRAKTAYWNEKNRNESDISPDWEDFAKMEYVMANVVTKITGKPWEEIKEGITLDKISSR
ncbi:unnamed protein product, partial [marine sediment metagenome]